MGIENNTTISDEINKFTRKYLLDTLGADFYASDFSQRHFESLLNELFNVFGQESVRTRMNIISTCITKHFKSFHQECEVTISDGRIRVTNQFKDGITSADMDKASIGLNVSLQELVQEKEKYALQEHLVCFPPDILNVLYEKFSDTSIKGDHAALRSVIRPSVEHNLNLESKDIVLFLRKKLYIRYFVDMKAVSKDENRRYLGVSPEHLEAVYKEHFPEDFSDILFEMAPEVIRDALDFGQISNLAFKAKYIEVFRTLVDVAMSEYTSKLDQESVLALNGYILRLHFDSLLYLCAEILIDMVMQRDRKADAFLRFYNGEIVVDSNGKKVKKPYVIDTKNNIWNYSSIFSVMTQCIQYKSQHKQQVAAFKESQKQYEVAEQLLQKSKKDEKKCSEELSKLKDELYALGLVKNNLMGIKKPTKEEAALLKENRAAENALLAKHDQVYSKKNESSLKLENARISQKNRLKQLEVAKRTLATVEKKGEELYIQQDDIFSALAKALIFR